MPLIALFDIDGTILLTGGAGRRAMALAYEDLYGVPDALGHLSLAGRTDAWILAQVLATHGHESDGTTLERFRARYLVHLAVELAKPAPGKTTMPGVNQLLHALAERPDVYLALVTGNYEQGARVKLEHFDLWRFFRAGGFGDQAHDRVDIVHDALARVRANGCPDATSAHAVVIGDTPFDISCAVRTGARSIGVATGGFTVDALREAGATYAFEDFSDTAAVLAAFDAMR